MLLYALLGLGLGTVLAGLVLYIASYTHQNRMRNPHLVRWAGVVTGLVGLLLGLIAIFWR